MEELLYPAMEDFAVNFVIDKGTARAHAQVRAASVHAGGGHHAARACCPRPLRERFGIFHHLDFYSEPELTRIVTRSAAILDVAHRRRPGRVEIARRARGTPRIVNRLLRRVRDYAQVSGGGRSSARPSRATPSTARAWTPGASTGSIAGSSARSSSVYGGGPVGIEALAATINDDAETLCEMVEPYLLKIGFLAREPRGRRVTREAYAHLGKPPPARPAGGQAGLFE